MKILIIIPAYNEEKNIYKVIKSIQEIEPLVDILVINDGSKDNTSFEANKAGAKVINLPFNLGIGGAVQTGYKYALYNNYDYAIQIDGDGQHNAEYIKDIISKLESGHFDMVIGSRFLNNTNYKPSFFRKIGIGYFSKLISKVIGQEVTDTTSGYRGINKKVIKIFSEYYPTDYPEPETIIYLKKRNIKIGEVPVIMNYRQGGKSSITPIKSIYYMIKVTLAILLQP